MATYLLDTCIIIDTLNNKRNRPAALRNLLNAGHLLACCAINDYACKGVTVNLGDVTIAAVALQHKLALLTDNLKDFPMEDLTLISP